MDPEVSFMVQSFREIDPSLQGVLIFYQKDFGSFFVWVSCSFPNIQFGTLSQPDNGRILFSPIFLLGQDREWAFVILEFRRSETKYVSFNPREVAETCLAQNSWAADPKLGMNK